MKKSYIKIISIEVFLILLFTFFGIFVLNIKNTISFKILLWLMTLMVLKIEVGLEKNKSLFKNDLIFYTFVFTFISLLAQYLFGIITGFVRTPYNLHITGLIKNIVPNLILIILIELVRYIILNKGKKNKLIIILEIILFILYDIITKIGIYDMSTKKGIFDTIILIILPSISKNILLTVMSIKGGYQSCILYNCIMELSVYIIPIIPDLGNYVDAIFAIVVPFLLLLAVIKVTKKESNVKINRGRNMIGRSLKYSIFVLLVIIVFLVSGYFKYYFLTIATGSMQPNIDVGDVVLVKKYNEEEISNIKKGDILVYKYDSKVIVHRVIKIDKINDTYIYRTKGDNNKSQDNWLVYEEQIIGVVQVNFKYVGYPAVLLNNYMNT